MTKSYGSDISPGQAGLGNVFVLSGNSLAQGDPTGLPIDTYMTIPNFNGQPFTKFNRGVAGITLSRMIYDPVTRMDSDNYVNSCFNDNAPVNIELVWELSNQFATGSTIAQCQGALIAYCRRRRALGIKVIVAPMISRAGGTSVCTCDQAKNQLYAWMVANWHSFADGFADFCIGPMGSDGGYANTTYYQADQTHGTNAMYSQLAPVALAAVNTLLAGLGASYQGKVVSLADIAARVAQLGA